MVRHEGQESSFSLFRLGLCKEGFARPCPELHHSCQQVSQAAPAQHAQEDGIKLKVKAERAECRMCAGHCMIVW